jgi:hypothetical protein
MKFGFVGLDSKIVPWFKFLILYNKLILIYPRGDGIKS